MTTSISGQSCVDQTMTTLTTGAASGKTNPTIVTGDEETVAKFSQDGNQAAGYKKTTFDGQNLALPMDQLAKPGDPQKALARLQELATSGGTVSLPSTEDAGVSQSTDAKGEVSYNINVTRNTWGGEVTVTTTVSAADIASGNLSQDVKDLLDDLTAGFVFVPEVKKDEPAPVMPAPTSAVEQKLQTAMHKPVLLESDVSANSYDVTYSEAGYTFQLADAFTSAPPITLSPEQIKTGEAGPNAQSGTQELLNQLRDKWD